MSILSIIIPVPVVGDGPFVDVSSLVGTKTVFFSGRFSGRYELLASHDDSHFVPVLQFDAGGVEGVRQTVSGSFKSFRLRAVAVPDGTVACEVSSELGAGENHYALVASLPAGFSGTSPAVDTSPLFPPTGPEEDTCFICSGALQGQVTVLGSADGVTFNPVGAFTAGRLPEGAPASLEFSVLPTTDKIRYVRLSTDGSISAGGITVTMGGRVPLGGGLAELVTNGSGSTLVPGELVRVSGDRVVTRAQADVPANAAGMVGASIGTTAAGAQGQVSNGGATFVLLEAGLAPIAGESLWLSAITGGRASNTAPAIPVYVGVIKDASTYGTTGGVLADLMPSFVLSTVATLRQTYSFGSVAADQTMSLLDAKGGGVVIAASGAGFTGANALTITNPSSGRVLFPRTGGIDVLVNQSVVPAAGTRWDAIYGSPSSLTLLAGGSAPNELAFGRIAAPVVHTGITGYAIPTAASWMVEGYPTYDGTGRIRSSWGLLVKNAPLADVHGITSTHLIYTSFGVNYASRVTQYDADVYWGDIYVATGNTTLGNFIQYIKTRSTDGITPAIVRDNDMVAFLAFNGDDGGDYLENVASIGVYIDGTPVLNKVPGRIVFSTTKQGDEGIIEAMRITNTHDVLIGTAVDAVPSRLRVYCDGSVAATAGALWNGIDFMASPLTLTGGPAVVTALTMVRVGTGTINGVGNTVSDAYNLFVDAAPGGTATLTRPWSLGVAGNARFNGIVALADGSVSAPSLTFITDRTCGIYHSGTGINGTINATINSVVRASLYALGGYIGTEFEVLSPDPGSTSVIASASSDFAHYLYFFGGANIFHPAIVWSSGNELRFGIGAYNASTFTEFVRITQTGSLLVGTTVAGTNAAKVLALTNSATAPSDSANLAQLYGADIAANRATLAVYAEEAVAADVGLASTHSFIVFINGAKYKWMLVSVP